MQKYDIHLLNQNEEKDSKNHYAKKIKNLPIK